MCRVCPFQPDQVHKPSASPEGARLSRPRPWLSRHSRGPCLSCWGPSGVVGSLDRREACVLSRLCCCGCAQLLLGLSFVFCSVTAWTKVKLTLQGSGAQCWTRVRTQHVEWEQVGWVWDTLLAWLWGPLTLLLSHVASVGPQRVSEAVPASMGHLSSAGGGDLD